LKIDGGPEYTPGKKNYEEATKTFSMPEIARSSLLKN
jgi:hypothetical protein